MHLHAVDVAHRVKTCAQGMSYALDLEAGVVIVVSAALVAGSASTAFVLAAVPVAASAVEVPGWLLVLWCRSEVSRRCSAEGSHSCSQANLQMSVQALQYGTGIVSAGEPEDDAVLPVRHLEMVWVALVKMLVDPKVVSRAVSQAVFQAASQVGVDVVLESQA